MAYYAADDVAVNAGSEAEYAHVAVVTSEFFRVFLVNPVAGRLFSAEEQAPASGGSAVISHSYWQSHSAGDPNVVVRSVRMLGKTVNIVGVLPSGFHFPAQTDLWFPANTIVPESNERSSRDYQVAGRVKRGVSLEQAQAEMAAVGARLENNIPRAMRARAWR
jgi:putative ABC transport system permease protein